MHGAGLLNHHCQYEQLEKGLQDFKKHNITYLKSKTTGLTYSQVKQHCIILKSEMIMIGRNVCVFLQAFKILSHQLK